MSDYPKVAPLLGIINRTLKDITLDELKEFEEDVRTKVILQTEPRIVIQGALQLLTALTTAKVYQLGHKS